MSTNNSEDLAATLEALVKINHGWKKDYEELRMRYEMLNGENGRIEDEKNTLKVCIKELEKQQTLLEKEISRLAALYGQQSSNGGQVGAQEQREILKSQLISYEKVFEREKTDREKLHEDKENFKRQLEDAEDIIKQLIAELDALDAAASSRAELIVEAL